MSGADLTPRKTRKLGRTDVGVTEPGPGAAPLGELFETVDDAGAVSTLLKVKSKRGVRG